MFTTTTTVTTTTTTTLNLFDLAKAIREGEIDFGTEYGMWLGERFHTIHVNTLKLSCTTCHKGDTYLSDHLYINIDRVYAKIDGGMPGVVDRAVCLMCRREGGPASPFYAPFYGEGLVSGAGG